MRLPSISRLHELFIYNSDDGSLVWRITPYPSRGRVAGQAAGLPDSQGYITICVENEKLLKHRLVWAMHYGEWPKGMLDHKNTIKTDCRIENLRPSNESTNGYNRGIPANNTHGIKGVVLHPHGRWSAQIGVAGKQIYLGSYDTKEQAGQAYEAAAKKYYGEFYRPQLTESTK